MKTTSSLAQTVYRSVTLAVVCAALSSGGCGLDEQTIPELGGPSTYGTQLKLSANPDVITAANRHGIAMVVTGKRMFRH